MINLSKLSENLQELMMERGLTQTSLADAIHACSSKMSSYITGKRAPNYATLISLVEFFHCSADFLLGLVDEQIRLVPYFRDLSEDEQLLLQAFSQLTARQKRAVEHLLAALADDGKKG